MTHAFFVIHLSVLILGLALFCASTLTALLYLLEHRQLKTKRPKKWLPGLPSLERLDSLTLRMLYVGFSFLTLGMLTGLVLAHVQWKGDWLSNPKFLLSLGVWLWYLVLLVVRYRAGLRGGRFFALIIAGFVLLSGSFAGFIWKSSL